MDQQSRNLQELVLDGAELTDRSIHHIARCTNLCKLQISFCEGLSDQALRYIQVSWCIVYIIEIILLLINTSLPIRSKLKVEGLTNKKVCAPIFNAYYMYLCQTSWGGGLVLITLKHLQINILTNISFKFLCYFWMYEPVTQVTALQSLTLSHHMKKYRHY